LDPDPESYFQLLSLVNAFPASLILPLIGVLVLLFLSALVSGSEVAFFALNPRDHEELKNQPEPRDKYLHELLQSPERLLATILINNNFINIAIILLAAHITGQIFNFSAFPIIGFAVEVVLITFLLLLFGEILPKVYATARRLPFARFMALPTYYSLVFWKPLAFFLIKSGSMLKLPARRQDNISIDDLTEAIRLTEDESGNGDEQKILEGIVRFGATNVKQIMKPRTDVIALEKSQPFDEVLQMVRDSGYSRIPVYEDHFDKIKGVLYIKDLLPYIRENDSFKWIKLIRPPFFVPETKKIDDLLREFRAKRIHLAIVVDEFGGTSGIVTLEDVLEEIVGEISDEFDDDDLIYSKLDDYTYVFEGKTPLNDFYRIVDIPGDDFENAKGDADSLAGFVLEIAGKFPEKNEVFHFDGYSFKTELIHKRRIQRLKISLPNPQNPNTGENHTDHEAS
jgi:putative hemolysin